MHLRTWRRRRGLSQLDLALHAGTTPRYVSFLETGRSRPGSEVVRRLCDALDVPLRERNAMLVAAGLSPSFPERALTDEALAPVNRVVDRMLAHHEPFPAWLMRSDNRLVRANEAASRLLPWLGEIDPDGIVDLLLEPGPLQDVVENWRDVAHIALGTMRAELLRRPQPELSELIARAEVRAERLGPAPDRWEVPVVCPVFRIDGRRVRTIATVIRFDNAVDVTVADLKIELMFPADDDSEAFFRDRAVEA